MLSRLTERQIASDPIYSLRAIKEKKTCLLIHMSVLTDNNISINRYKKKKRYYDETITTFLLPWSSR